MWNAGVGLILLDNRKGLLGTWKAVAVSGRYTTVVSAELQCAVKAPSNFQIHHRVYSDCSLTK